MTTTDTNLNQLIIHELTKAQYEALTPEANQLYLTPDTTDQDIADAVSAHNSSNSAHSDIRGLISNLIPTQSGQSGKFLTTNGSVLSWATVDAFPTQTGNAGKFLTTNGSAVSWADVPTEIPTQTGQSGKFLTTNGSAVSWGEVDLSGKVDKVTSTSLKNRFYIVTPAGNQSTLEGEQTGQTATTVPIRTSTGTIRTATPTDDNDAATKKYVDDSIPVAFTGATGSVAGTSGLVPQPAATDNTKFLKGDGTWATVDAFPSQTGNSGKFLTTNGTTVSWAESTTWTYNSSTENLTIS